MLPKYIWLNIHPNKKNPTPASWLIVTCKARWLSSMEAFLNLSDCHALLQPPLPLKFTKNTATTTSLITKHNYSKFNSLLVRLQTFKKRRTSHVLNHIQRSQLSYTASPFYESKDHLKIGIIGFGNFGQFIARAFQGQGHVVLVALRSDYSHYCQQHGIEFYW